MPTDFSDKPVLIGDRVVLRPFTLADVPAIARIIDDPEVRRLTGSEHLSFTMAELTAVTAQRLTQADRLDLAVVDKATNILVGEVVLNEWDPDRQSCNFRTLLGPGARDRGLGTEATALTVAHGFTQLGLRLIHLHVYAFNPRARRVYEKVGFTEDGADPRTGAIRMSLRRP